MEPKANRGPWETRTDIAAGEFAEKCAELYEENPYDEVVLKSIINTLMTELWDQGFSQSEIRASFEDALSDMSRYAAGEERRGGREMFAEARGLPGQEETGARTK